MKHPPMHIDELVEHWTILDDEHDLIAGKRDATRLGFAILLKFYTQHGRFPRGRSELPDDVAEHVAKQVQVPASELGFYEWSGSTIEYHRSQIRTHLGFRTCTTADATKLAVWLAENVAHAERRTERVRGSCSSICARSGSNRRRRAGSPGSRLRLCTTRRSPGRCGLPPG
ncbi:DUF4158 domain-containing protein [Nonomuraea sp. NPDC005983]|uniref:DUF4158 domain-containing protein n=1 Tax=Nonomuraea sp. NPDC005983 TaxID=3155595 RepID=UPI0033AC63C3